MRLKKEQWNVGVSKDSIPIKFVCDVGVVPYILLNASMRKCIGDLVVQGVNS